MFTGQPHVTITNNHRAGPSARPEHTRSCFLTFEKNIFFFRLGGGKKIFLGKKNFLTFFFTITTTTRYYHQQPPRGTFCSPRAHTFLFVVKFRPNNGWWFYENVRAHPPVLLGVTLFKGIYRQVVMCQTCSVVPVLIWFHFVSLKRL